MQTVEVPQRDWGHELDMFSVLHEGTLVSLDIIGLTLGVQPQIRELPLRGVTAESSSHGPSIIISASGSDGEHITHLILSPTHVRIERTNDGADVALQIESEDGLSAILRFQP